MVPSGETCPTCTWNTLIESINCYRDVPIQFLYREDGSPSRKCREWLESSPALMAWAKSPYCLRSPSSWPEFVLPAFKHRLIPTPFDLCNIRAQSRVPKAGASYAQYLKTLLYCLGFTVDQIAEFVGDSERDIERDMYNTIEEFFKIPQFLLWATGTDFTKSLLPSYLPSLEFSKKAEIIHKVTKNPFLLGDKDARRFVESSRYLTYLVYGSPKKPRITKDCRFYYTKEG